MDHLEVKSRFAADDAGTIMGIAWPFATADRVGDMVQKGAFAGVTPVPMLFGHDPLQPIGMWDHLEETDEGLQVRGQLLIGDVARAREVHALVKKGAVTGLSIGFRTKSSFRRPSDRGRTITALDLAELSLVTFPSHPGARITAAKSAALAIAEPYRIAEAINRAAMALRTAA